MARGKSRRPQGDSEPADGGDSKRMSRRSLLKGGATVGVAAALGGAAGWITTHASRAAATRPPDPSEPDLVFVNGRIHTMDASNTVVSSVGIKDGRFAEVGQGAKGQGPGKRVINLKGLTVVPGIIDNHNHVVLMGNRPGYHTPLENAYSIADVQAIYAARAQGVPAGKWITTIGGFNPNHFAELRLPNAAELDAAVPGHPVFIEVGFTGPSATNIAGRDILRAHGVTVSDTGAIAGGTQSSAALLFLRQTLLNPEERRRSVLDAMGYAASLGVTTHLDQGAFQKTGTTADGSAHEDNYTMHLPFLEVYGEGTGLVRLRINFLHMEANLDTPELVQRLKNAFPFFGDDMVRTGGIGEFIAQGTSASSPFVNAAKKVAHAGWRAEVHSLGRRNTPSSAPADFELEIMGFEAADAENKGIVGDMRWVIAHVPGITQEWIDRLKALGGGLSLTGWQYLAGTMPTSTVAPYAGPPFRMIVDSGIDTGMSSDGMQIAPMNPWIHMYYATTGLNARHAQINPGQHITRQEVLELYTRRNGWFLREEDQLGSIEVGKLADLVVLNDDYFTVPDEDLKKIRSVLTVVDGRIVHDAGVVT